MSAYTSGQFKQELPPPGGYEEINFKRVPAQRIFGCMFIISYGALLLLLLFVCLFVSDKAAFIASCVLTVYSAFHFKNRMNYMKRMRSDYYDHIIAVEPLALAEQDRA